MATEEQDLQDKVQRLGAELERLQRQLGELHTTDTNALRRAYRSLCQHVDALEGETKGLVEELEELETEVVEPKHVADELGVAASLAVGVSLFQVTILRSLPGAAARLLGRSLWLAGGAYVLFRLSGGALGRVLGAFRRNHERKRHLRHRLETVQDRVGVMVALQQWAERQVAPGGPEAGGSSAPGQQPERVSPAASTDSAEMVEMPAMATPPRGAGRPDANFELVEK